MSLYVGFEQFVVGW